MARRPPSTELCLSCAVRGAVRGAGCVLHKPSAGPGVSPSASVILKPRLFGSCINCSASNWPVESFSIAREQACTDGN